MGIFMIDQSRRRKRAYRRLMPMALLMCSLGMMMGLEFGRLTKKPVPQSPCTPIVVKPIELSPQGVKIAQLAKKEKVSNPVKVATVLQKAKYPKMLTAIASVESSFNTSAVGDSGQSRGAFQVKAKHWGRVPDGLENQTDQATKILESLLEESNGNWRIALNKYGGCTDGRYANKVFRKVAELR